MVSLFPLTGTKKIGIKKKQVIRHERRYNHYTHVEFHGQGMNPSNLRTF